MKKTIHREQVARQSRADRESTSFNFTDYENRTLAERIGKTLQNGCLL